ncbi:MAG: hypothetical protein SGPRY_007968 [Prymnesium sp.]
MLAAADASYRTPWEQGYVLSRGRVVTLSSTHSKHHYHNNVKRCDFANPSPPRRFVRISTTAATAEIPAEEKDHYLRLLLIKKIAAESTTVTSKVGTRAALDLVELVKTGLTAASVNAFDRFRERYKDLNDQQLPAWRADESVMSKIFAAAVRDLGPLVATRLDLALSSPSYFERHQHKQAG